MQEVAPSLLLPILPALIQPLNSTNQDRRAAACSLFISLLSMPGSNLAYDFPKVFQVWGEFSRVLKSTIFWLICGLGNCSFDLGIVEYIPCISVL